jgi:hypothetical protein
MGLVYADIELINGGDLAMARRNLMDVDEVKRIHVNILVVEVRFKNRQTTCRAMVLPDDSEPLLGAIPLEDMDVLIHPQRQELIMHPDHPYFAQMKLKGIRKTFTTHSPG